MTVIRCFITWKDLLINDAVEVPARASRRHRPLGGGTGEVVRLLSDSPVSSRDSDYFGYSTFAGALAEIIDNEATDTPLTVALSAPWGAGKTSVATMIEADLTRAIAQRGGERGRIVCWFNAWEHNDAHHLGASLAAQVARTANCHRQRWRRVLEPLPAAMLSPQNRWRRVFVTLLATVAAAAILVIADPTRQFVEGTLQVRPAVVGGAGSLLWLGLMTWRGLFSTASNAARFVDDPASEAARGSMSEVKEQLGRLIDQATRGGRLLIFVDDLDRCRASRAVEIFEVCSQLLAHPGVVTVLLADMETLAHAATVAYGSEVGSTEQDMGRRYLEKLVQIELDLPPPNGPDMKLLLRGAPPVGATEETVAENERQRRRFLNPGRVAGFAAYAASTILIVTVLLEIVFSPGDGTFVATRVLVTIAIGLAFIALVANLLRLRDRRRRRDVRRRVESVLTGEGNAPTEHTESLVRAAAGEEKLEAYAGQVAESLRTVRSPEVEAVEAFIAEHPPRFPRSAKRMLNHARLLTKIARDREMFGGSPALTPDHLGKWIVLGERWPELAELIGDRPPTAGDDRGLLDLYIAPEGANANTVDRELDDLLKAPPELTPVIDRLIHFKPAEAPQAR